MVRCGWGRSWGFCHDNNVSRVFRTICVLSAEPIRAGFGSRVYYVDYFSCKLHKASWRRACFWFNAFKLEESELRVVSFSGLHTL